MLPPSAAPLETTKAIRLLAIFRALLVFNLAGALSACVVSKQHLFDPNKAAMPVVAGNFAEEENKDGHWTRKTTIKLVQDGRSYRLDREEDKSSYRFTLHEIGSGFYVGAVSPDAGSTQNPKLFIYVLVDKRSEGFVYYEPVCSDFKFLRLPSEIWPLIDGDNCIYDNKDKLTQALLVYASLSEPDKRYVPLKP